MGKQDYYHHRKLLIEAFNQVNQENIPWIDGPFTEAAETFNRLAGHSKYLNRETT